jgi:O-antigen/teichoic acid export membrane protein
LAIALFQNFDRIIVSFVLGPAIAGVYSVGNSIGTRLSQIVGQITDTMIPYASLKNSINDHETLYKTFRKMVKYISLLVSIIASLCIIWMSEILSIWISPAYSEKYTSLFQVILLAYAFLSLSRPGDQALTGLGKVKFAAITYMIASLLMLTGVYFLSKRFGIFGAGSANLIMLLLLVMNVKTYHILTKKVVWKDFLQDLLFGILFPLISFLIFQFYPNTYERLFFSLVIITVVVFLFIKDDYAKDILSTTLQRLKIIKK